MYSSGAKLSEYLNDTVSDFEPTKTSKHGKVFSLLILSRSQNHFTCGKTRLLLSVSNEKLSVETVTKKLLLHVSFPEQREAAN